jgi:hypothetical protein
VLKPWCDTEFGPQIAAQAWSGGDASSPVSVYRKPRSWASVLRRAGIGIGFAVAVGGVLLAIVGPRHSEPDTHNAWPSGYTNPPAPQLPPETPEPPLPKTLRPVPDAQEVTHDGAYLQTLVAHGSTIRDPATTIENAHITCHNLGLGVGHNYVVMWMYRTNDPGVSGLSLQEIATVVDIDAAFYCPGLS